MDWPVWEAGGEQDNAKAFYTGSRYATACVSKDVEGLGWHWVVDKRLPGKSANRVQGSCERLQDAMLMAEAYMR